jgi:hypothetical protein
MHVISVGFETPKWGYSAATTSGDWKLLIKLVFQFSIQVSQNAMLDVRSRSGFSKLLPLAFKPPHIEFQNTAL